MERQKERALILSQETLADGIFDLWIHTEAAADAKPGQFFSLYTDDPSRLLPRPISICDTDKQRGAVRLVYRVTGKGTGTEQFSRKRAGEYLSVTGPLGNGFPAGRARGKRALLVGGGIGVPPFVELAKEIQCEKLQIVVGYRDAQTFLAEEFPKYGEVYVSTEDGSVGTKGNVLDAVQKHGLEADLIYACGPAVMLRAVKRYAEERQMECYLSLEERMACGVGACLACVCQSRDIDAHSQVHNKRVCKDGPVFLSTEVEI